MTLGEYVTFVGEKIRQAEGKQDKEEVIRPSRLLIETLTEKIVELTR